jgi:hypothetical protein
MNDTRTIRDLQSLPADRVARCRALLVETAVALVVQKRLVLHARTLLVGRLQVALADLACVVEEPIYVVRMAAERVVRAYEKPDAWTWQDQAENDLRIALQSYFAARSDAAISRLSGADPVLIES